MPRHPRRSRYDVALEELERSRDIEHFIKALESSERHIIHAALTALRALDPVENDRAMIARAIIAVRAPLTLELELERVDAAVRYCDALDNETQLPDAPLVSDALVVAKWSSVRLAIDPGDLSTVTRDDTLDAAIAQIGHEHFAANPALPFALLRCNEQKSLYAEHAVALIERAVEHGSLRLEQAVKALALGLKHDSPEVRAASLGVMTRCPWAKYASPEIPTTTLREMCRSRSTTLRRAAVTLLGELEQVDAFELLLKDTKAPQDVRRIAMKHLACAANKRALGDIIQIAAAAPEIFATEALAALETLHHSGVFIAPEQIEDVLLLHIHTDQTTAKDICTLMYTCRQELLDVLRRRGPRHPHWRRHLALLEHLKGGGALLGELLHAWSDTQNVARLRGALNVARSLADPALEGSIWLAAPHCFAECISALETCATEHTHEKLERMLGVREPQHTPNLSDQAHEQASMLLWALSSEGHREQLLAPRFDPIKSGNYLFDRLFARTPKYRRGAYVAWCAHEGRVSSLIEVICARESVDDEPLIRELFTRWLVLSRDYANSEHRPAPWNQQETQVPAGITRALESFGAHLYSTGQARPRRLAALKTSREAGQFYANHVLLESLDLLPTLDRESAAPMLLSALRTPLHPAHIQRVKPLIRSKSPRVRREVIRATAASNDPGMLTWFRALTQADDIESIRQAIDALGQYAGTWSAGVVAECLEHRNMNIKVSAARALAKVGTTRVLDRLLFWLGHHDNSGLRAALTDALVAISGSRANASVIITAKLTTEHEARRLALLNSALDDLDELHDVSDTERAAPLRPHPLDALFDTEPEDRARVIDAITSQRAPAELVAPHIDALLRWCADEALQARRGTLLRWLTPHLATPLEDVRIERIALLRALAPLPVQAGLVRRAALRACDATLGVNDHVTFLEDARCSLAPDMLIDEIIASITGALASSTDDSLDLSRDQPIESMRGLSERAGSLRARATTLADDTLDRWIARLVCLRPLLTRTQTTAAQEVDAIEPTDQLIMALRAHDEHERSRAASALTSRYIGPELELELFSMYLNGQLSNAVRPGSIARALDWIDPNDLLSICGELDPDETQRLLALLGATTISGQTLPVLLEVWRSSDEELRAHARQIIRRLPAATVLSECIDRIEAGEHEHCSLLAGKLVDGALTRRLRQSIGDQHLERIDVLTVTPPVFAHAPIPEPDVLELLDQHEASRDRRDRQEGEVNEPTSFEEALTALKSEQTAEILTGLRFLRGFRDEAIAELIFELLDHDNSKVRSTAARTLRYVGSKEISRRGSIVMLGDARRDVRISALDSLGHARYTPAITHIMPHLLAKDQREREHARAALELIGEPAIPNLIYARSHARPDQRDLYDSLIEAIEGSS